MVVFVAGCPSVPAPDGPGSDDDDVVVEADEDDPSGPECVYRPPGDHRPGDDDDVHPDDDDDDDGDDDDGPVCPVYAEWSAAAPHDGSYALPWPSIADAIAHLPPGCLQIGLFPGTSEEAVDYGGLDLDIASLSGPEVTTITPPTGTAVTIAGDQSAAAALTGVTLTGGTGTAGFGALDVTVDYGGGLLVYESDPTTTACALSANEVDGFGGGGALYGFDGTFSGNLVQDNIAHRTHTGGGGGLRVTSSDGELTHNTFVGNQALGTSMDGGALEVVEGAPLIAFNRFEGNVASETGGAIRSADSGARILTNLFVANDPDGLVLTYGDDGPVAGNTFVDNTLYGITTRTCCGYSGPGPTSEVVDTLVIGSGVHGFAVREGVQALVLSHNDVWDSGTGGYAGMADPTEADGNLAVDPEFVSPFDLHLQLSSPVLSAGVDASGFGVAVDYDGVTRPAGGAWSMGAYEGP